MKINIVTGSLYSLPPVGYGAVEKVWYDCAKYFASKGHEVSILACKGDGELANEKVDNVSIYRATNFKSTKSLAVNIVYECLYSFYMLSKLPTADVTVLNSVFMPIIAPMRRKKTGIIVYNLQRFPKKNLGFYKRVDRISIVSNAVKNAAVSQTPSVAPLSKVIPNPINTNIFCYKDINKSIRKNITLVYSGRIHPEKGIDLLIKATKKLYKANSNIILKLIGTWDVDKSGGGEGYVTKLKSIADDLPLVFMGGVSDPKILAEEMRKGDIYIYPSQADIGEAFGVAPLEAMALGLPVVVSGLDCFKDFVQDEINALVFDHRGDEPVDSLVYCLQKLIDDNIFRESLAAEAVKTAQRFSIENVAEQYLDDFKMLCSKK